MRIVLTGAGGFLGRSVLPLLSGHEVVALDKAFDTAAPENVTRIEGDLCDPACLRAAFMKGCDAVIHLATIPGAASEQNPALAKAVNIDASMALLDAAALSGVRPRFVFASSIAALGDNLPAHVDDETPLRPTLIYGAHKAMLEQWIETQTRRGAIAGASLRFSGLVARPPGPSGMKSAFLSEVFHAMRANRRIALPVGPQAAAWLMSATAAARALAHALTLSKPAAPLTLPALRVRISDLVAEIARQTRTGAENVVFEPDPHIEGTFGRFPPLCTQRADALGFAHDGTLERLVARALATLAKEDRR